MKRGKPKLGDYHDGRSKAWPGGPTIAALRREMKYGQEIEKLFGPPRPGRRAGNPYIGSPRDLFPRSWQHKLEKWAIQYPRIELVLLYGSRSRDDGREDSDVDLAVVLTEDNNDTAAGLWVARGSQMTDDLQSRFSVKVDLRCTQHPGASLTWLKNVRRDGLIVYRRKASDIATG